MSEKDFYQISLKAFLRNDRGELLILGALSEGTYAGYYDLPGGRIGTSEFNTPLANILKREIFEELQVSDVEVSDLPVALGRHEIPPGQERDGVVTRVLYIFFEAKLLAGEPVLSHEHSSLQWVNLNEIDVAKYFKSGIRQGVEMYINRRTVKSYDDGAEDRR